MTMLRAGADIIGYELREDFANRARSNVESFLGAEALARYDVQLRDCYDGIDETGFDRVVLDLPEPWQVVKHAERALHPGGILVAYTPSITQAVQLRERARAERLRHGRDASRCSTGAGTSRARRSARTIGWSRTPGFLTHARLLGR